MRRTIHPLTAGERVCGSQRVCGFAAARAIAGIAALLLLACATSPAAEDVSPEQAAAIEELRQAEQYYSGEGVEEVDYVESEKWARMAAERGYAPAQRFMGGLYRLGTGVPQDHEASVRWYRLAAEQGDAAAQFFLAAAYDFGAGVAADLGEALKWYELAADQGSGEAQLNAGLLYLYGAAEKRNKPKALKWLLLAATQGNEKAYDVAQSLVEELTPEQLIEADVLVTDWQRSHGLMSPAKEPADESGDSL